MILNFLTFCLLVVVCVKSDDSILQARLNGLNKHNLYRKLHHVGNLSLRGDLNEYAKTYADKFAKSGVFAFSGGKFGENLFEICGQGIVYDDIIKLATDSWYDQVQNYDFNNQGFNISTGSFTQLVWNSTKFVGFGISFMNNCYYIVASYDPAGNVNDQFDTNVFEIVETKKHTKKKLIIAKSDDDMLTQARSIGLDQQNYYRALHHVANLTLNDDLNLYAQRYAKVLAHTGLFIPSGGKYGENLYELCGNDINYTDVIKQAIDSWYSGINNYDFNTTEFSIKSGTFTQLVWASTMFVGYGIGHDVDSDCYYIVASYVPAGNIIDRFRSNVFEINSSNSSNPEEDISQARLIGLNLQNYYRNLHHAANLTLRDDLNDNAQQYAESLVNNSLFVPSGEKFGVNLFRICDVDAAYNDLIKHATDNWHQEIVYYNFNYPKYTIATGAFTQLVWASTKFVGFGIGYDDNLNCYYVVASYDPVGNVNGQFGNNALQMDFTNY